MTRNLYVEENWINRTKDARIDDSGVYETRFTRRGDLYRAMRREYGRCTGRVYIDTDNGPKRVGWVFVKKAYYEDTQKPYIQETWITLHKAPPTKTVNYHYA